MAAPTATGSTTTQTTATQSTKIGLPSATGARTTGTANTIRAAPSATQRSCWRSTPWARRKRTTSDPAATATARAVTTRATRVATSRTPSKARSLKGLLVTSSCGSNRPGTTGTTSTKATGVAAVMTAHRRQRGEGSDPVGVNSSTKLSKASAAGPVAG